FERGSLGASCRSISRSPSNTVIFKPKSAHYPLSIPSSEPRPSLITSPSLHEILRISVVQARLSTIRGSDLVDWGERAAGEGAGRNTRGACAPQHKLYGYGWKSFLKQT